MYVPLVSREAVNTAELDRRALLGICQAAGIDEIGVFVFTLQLGEEDDATVFSRMFAPAFGVAEDPATGAASGPLGAYLIEYGAVHADAGRAHVVSAKARRWEGRARSVSQLMW